MPPEEFTLSQLVKIRAAIEELRGRLQSDSVRDLQRERDLAHLWGVVNDKIPKRPPTS
jgi:hypothetical protein